jgi:DNA polymerase-3 subunit gamma/tau
VVPGNVSSPTPSKTHRTNRVAHGYIFSGGRGGGKLHRAHPRQSLNCARGPTVTPAGCACLQIAAGNSVDVFEIDAASNRGIDEIRELRENVRYLPARDRYRFSS